MKRTVYRPRSVAGALWMFFLLALAPATAQFHKQVNLVSDISGTATVTDPLLVNPWGMSFGPTTPFWVSDQGTNTATLYAVDGTTGAVTKIPLNVSIPASPSGQAFNDSPDFVVTKGGASGPALFLFAGLNGTISGWNPNVPPPAVSMQAILAATGSPAPASYTGLTLASMGSQEFLYAANNASPGRIDVFDQSFTKVSVAGTFTDPSLPAGDLPFNIVNIGNSLYVTYSGPTGVVDVFDTSGHFMSRFATGGTLLNPWGIALAPANFGEFSNALLVGNFNFGTSIIGPGHISAFDSKGNFLGLVEDTSGVPISINGLWTLTFGNDHEGGSSGVLYFTAGIEGQSHGLFGSLEACGGPDFTGVSASPNALWPPNHQMAPVTINYTVNDNCDPAPVCSLSVSDNEGGGGGSGHTSPDWIVLDAHHVDLRAERAGTGNGRVYTIAITCQDKLGLSSNTTTAVTVAHDQGKNNKR
ncbi:MAG TPA: TIGR03118 family protein [Bryobacteraceae bacterium]|nr:TIGR03118 family protein [Bryobacteraceae bacterium]